MTLPPRLPLRWLEWYLHADERHEIIGDLNEQFQHRLSRDGLWSARSWFWRESVRMLWGFGWHRRDLVSTDHERTRGVWLLWNAASDWRYAWRSLLASRGTSAVALLTLTLGLGLSTPVFSLTNSLLVRSLPYPQADRLIRLVEARPPRGQSGSPVFDDAGGSVSDVALGQLVGASTLELVTPYSTTGRNVTTPAGTEQRLSADVGPAFFDLLGAQPVRGRLFGAGDLQSEAASTVVVSASFWREALGSREDVVGSSLVIEAEPYTVIGVASSDIRFPESGIDLWTVGRWNWPAPGGRRNFQMWIEAVGRLAADASVEDASAEVGRIGAGLAAADPAFLDGADVPVPQFRVRRLQDDLVQPIRPALIALSLGMGLVLLAAGANLVNLLLARGTTRHREIAVRLALGASRWRVVRPLLFEQLLLSVGGAIGGTVLAWWVLAALPTFAPEALAQLVDVEFDAWSLGFVVGNALLLGVFAGLLPAWQLPRANLRDVASGGRVALGRRTASADVVRRVLVAGQVALSVMLLIGAMLMARTLWSLTSVNPGYQGEGVLTFQIGFPDDIFRQPERQSAFFDEVLSRLAQHSDVVAAGVSATLPLNNVGFSGTFSIEGRPIPAPPEPRPRADQISILGRYLEAVGTRVVRGRSFTSDDTATSEPVALIDETIARLYFAGEDPIGQRIDYIRKLRRIVGVVEAIKQTSVTLPSQPVVYYPASQLPAVVAFNRNTGGIAVRTTGDPMGIVPFVRTAAADADPDSPIYRVERLDDRLTATFAAPRFIALTLSLFAVLALTTSLLGVYGVLSYSVERRHTEFGIRRALGGDTRHILTLIVRQALILIGLGAGLGMVVALAGTGILQNLLFGVEPLDSITFLAAFVLTLAAGLAAASVPAWRALRVEPARALRAD